MSAPRIDVDGVSVSPDHYINGERIASSRTFEDRSPLDWTWKLADVARASAVAGSRSGSARCVVPFCAVVFMIVSLS